MLNLPLPRFSTAAAEPTVHTVGTDDGAKMAAGYAWFLVLGSVFLCNLMKTLLPSISSFVSIDYNNV